MNSSDATPDNSPPSSPLPTLPPPKAKRQPAARPRKPKPPKELVLKIKPPGIPSQTCELRLGMMFLHFATLFFH